MAAPSDGEASPPAEGANIVELPNLAQSPEEEEEEEWSPEVLARIIHEVESELPMTTDERELREGAS
jgi:hypothetical protein